MSACSLIVGAIVGAATWRVTMTRTVEVATPARPIPPCAVDEPTDGGLAGCVYVDDVPAAATVHVRAAAPDPRGLFRADVTTAADGTFRVEQLPRGAYQLLVTAPGHASRVVYVDTTAGEVPRLELFAYPCHRSWGAVVEAHIEWIIDADELLQLLAKPRVPAATLEIAGVEVGTTATGGWFALCASAEGTALTIRRDGYAAGSAWIGGEGGGPVTIGLEKEAVVTGRVVDGGGQPVAGVIVQPFSELGIDHGPRAVPQPVTAVSDGQGRFQIRGVAPVVRSARPGWSEGRYYRLTDGESVHEIHDPASSDHVELVLPPPAERRTGVVSGSPCSPGRADGPRVRGVVLHDGVPVPDAIVVGNVPRGMCWTSTSTRTDRHGRFDLRMSDFGHGDIRAYHARGWNGATEIVLPEGGESPDIVLAVDTEKRELPWLLLP